MIANVTVNQLGNRPTGSKKISFVSPFNPSLIVVDYPNVPASPVILRESRTKPEGTNREVEATVVPNFCNCRPVVLPLDTVFVGDTLITRQRVQS